MALPHGRLPELTRPIVALGILPEDRSIEFGSADEPPVDMIFLTLSPEEPVEAHLKVLSSIARFLSSDDARILLRHAEDGAEAQRLLEKYSTPRPTPASP